jgi:hypothetical protein
MPEIKISSLETPQAPKPTKAGQVIRRDRIAGRFSYRAVFRPDDTSRPPEAVLSGPRPTFNAYGRISVQVLTRRLH